MLRAFFLLLAAVSALPAQLKIAIINTQQAVLDTAEIQKASKDLEAKFGPRQQQGAALQKEIADLQAQLQQGQGKLTPQAEQSLTAQGQRRQRDLQRLTEDLQTDVERERNDVLSRAGTKMRALVERLATERGLDMVIDVNDAVYFKPALEITKEATAAYDKAHPAQ